MHRPAVLFLDEPTTGLDPESRTQLWRLVAELAADGTTVLLTTQYLEEADALADRVVIIDRGRVVGEGPPHELRKRIGSAVVALEFADEHAAVRAQRQLGAQFPAAQRHGPIVRLASEAGSLRWSVPPARSPVPTTRSPCRSASPPWTTCSWP